MAVTRTDVTSNHAVTDFFFFSNSVRLFMGTFLGWSTTSIFHFFRCARLLHILPVLCVKWNAKLQMGYMECKVTNVIDVCPTHIIFYFLSIGIIITFHQVNKPMQ